MSDSTITLHQAVPEDLMKQWRRTAYNRTAAEKLDPHINCLLVLLEALDWKGSPKSLIDAFPYDGDVSDVSELRDVMARLGYKSTKIKTYGQPITKRLTPCLYVNTQSSPYIAKTEGDDIVFYDGETEETELAKRIHNRGAYYIFEKTDIHKNSGLNRSAAWTRHVFKQFKSLIMKSFLISFIVNLLSMMVPLAIMMIYDQVIAKESKETLIYVASGVLIALGFELLLRVIRAKEQAYIGARFDYLIGCKIFEQILHLSPMYTERAPVEGQVGRIRSFESLREIFSGSLATTLLDLPFVFLFIIVIAIIAGPLVIVPIVLAGLYLLIGFLTASEIMARSAINNKSRSGRHAFLMEMVWQLRTIKQRASEKKWEERYRHLSGLASWNALKLARYQSNVQNIAQTIMMASGVATLVFGVLLVMENEMSLGALVAVMMLVWRVLAPIQSLFNLGGKAEQMQTSLKQLRSILDFEPEQEPQNAPQTSIQFVGAIELNRVSMRYRNDANPAILGLNLKIQPGEIIAVTGHSGSGKTTLAKLILGMYRPQGGAVLLDDVDIRQLRPITLRQTLAYVPQSNHAFPGSLLDNLTIANPSASFAKVRKACRQVGILKTIEALPNGFDTEFKEGLQGHIPQNFLRKVALARALLRDAPVLILDEPAGSMDDKDEKAFLDVIEKIRGKKTILMITQRPSHMRLCDRLLVLKEGQLDLLGPPDKVLERLFAKPTPPPTQPAQTQEATQ